MDSVAWTFSDETMCRICFKKQDTVFSLFRKRKGISPAEKLNKIGVKADVNDTGPSCICCDCLVQLETTVHFLEKCEKSMKLLAEHLGDVFKGSNAPYLESRVVDGMLDECEPSVKQELKSDDELQVEEAQCEECGSRRRCQHWAPPVTHTCPKCQKVFNRKYNFKLHLKRHGLKREWSCARCGANALSRWLAARHCVPRARRPCPVPGCGKTYTSNTNLSVHLSVHNGWYPLFLVRGHLSAMIVERSSPVRILCGSTTGYTQVRSPTSVPSAASSSVRTSCQSTWPPTPTCASAAPRRAAASATGRGQRCSDTCATTPPAPPARPPPTPASCARRATTTRSPSTSTSGSNTHSNPFRQHKWNPATSTKR